MNDEERLLGTTAFPDDVWEGAEPPAEVREAILDRTLRVVRSRRRRRRAALAAAALALFVLGAGTGRLLEREPPAASAQAIREDAAPEVEDVPLPADPRRLMARIDSASEEERVALLRAAGDEYLAPDRADPVAALYCYRRLLADGGAEAHVGTDTWLLTYLKLARHD